MKIRIIIITVLTCSLVVFENAVAAESLERLQGRIKLERIDDGIKAGNRQVFAALPAKGYKNGITGILNKYNVDVNPEYSFTDCSGNSKFTSPGSGLPGCRVSLKLGRKLPDGSFRDIGIRMEYAIGIGERQFVPNNSVWANYAFSGNKGVLDGNLRD